MNRMMDKQSLRKETVPDIDNDRDRHGETYIEATKKELDRFISFIDHKGFPKRDIEAESLEAT